MLLSTAAMAEKPFVRVKWNQATMRITYKDTTTSYTFNQPPSTDENNPHPNYQKLFLYEVSKVTTDFLDEKDGVVYMVSDISGPSRGPQAASSMCGAGEEHAKAFFIFNAKGEIKPPSYILYDSCLFSIGESNEQEAATDTVHGKLLKAIEFLRHEEPYNARMAEATDRLITVNVYFDPEHPELGLQAVESCIMHGPWMKSNLRVQCPS